MGAPKYYVVWEGRARGVFKSWAACKAQTEDYAGAKYKAFDTQEAAEAALAKGYAGYYKDNPAGEKGGGASGAKKKVQARAIVPSIAVDAACSGNPGRMEYRGVDTATGELIFHQGVFEDGTNNIGEFLAIVHALAFLQKHNSLLPIYTDSQTAMAWVRKKCANTKLERTGRNDKLFELIARAEKWLVENSYSNVIYKWDTARWGEIPADFGRKG